jgi:hypothetical protein
MLFPTPNRLIAVIIAMSFTLIFVETKGQALSYKGHSIFSEKKIPIYRYFLNYKIEFFLLSVYDKK